MNSKTMRSTLLVITVLTMSLIFAASVVNAQEVVSSQQAVQAKAATAPKVSSSSKDATSKTDVAPAPAPVFTDYKGIQIGMSADDVRNKLDHLKEKSKVQDFFVFSDRETAQVFYDPQGKVMAVAVTYAGGNNTAPKPVAVLGEQIQAKADGSMYEMKRYPAAGYWVAYSRTAGDSPVITVTMQKFQ